LPDRVNPLGLVVFLGHFLFDLVRASFQVAWLAIDPRRVPTSSIVAVQLSTKSDLSLTLTALAVSLVPGSLVVEADRQDDILYLHVLGTETAADVEKACRIVVDAKTQYVAVCNAAETLLVARGNAAVAIPALVGALQDKGVEVRGTEEVAALAAVDAIATDEDWDTEYLSLTISVKLVDGVDEALEHINRHGSHHTDAIVTEDAATAARFMQLVDSAGVYWNASTRFADGFRYGFGAEVGISTSKLHARGPVGLEGLVTYKYKLTGDGHIVADYASGARSFPFRALQ
jgi:glutamate-5-semialdehyde dehydrogenase